MNNDRAPTWVDAPPRPESAPDALVRLLVAARIAPCSQSPARAARDACDVADDGAVWRESYAPDAFIATPTPAPVVFRHDGPSVGYVFSVSPHGAWYEAELVIECDDEQRDFIHPGRAVSIDARSIRRSDDADLRIRRHRLVRLDAVAILADHERPWYPDAKLLRVRELPARTVERARQALGGYVLREGDEVIDHVRGTVHRFEAGRLVPA